MPIDVDSHIERIYQETGQVWAWYYADFTQCDFFPSEEKGYQLMPENCVKGEARNAAEKFFAWYVCVSDTQYFETKQAAVDAWMNAWQKWLRMAITRKENATMNNHETENVRYRAEQADKAASENPELAELLGYAERLDEEALYAHNMAVAEKSAVGKMLEVLPEECVIDRMSLEARQAKLETELGEDPEPTVL